MMLCAKPKSLLLLLACCLPATFVSCGCGRDVLYQPANQPVRLAEPVSARIWVRDQNGQWVKSANRVTLPEGFDVLPPPAMQLPSNPTATTEP